MTECHHLTSWTICSLFYQMIPRISERLFTVYLAFGNAPQYTLVCVLLFVREIARRDVALVKDMWMQDFERYHCTVLLRSGMVCSGWTDRDGGRWAGFLNHPLNEKCVGMDTAQTREGVGLQGCWGSLTGAHYCPKQPQGLYFPPNASQFPCYLWDFGISSFCSFLKFLNKVPFFNYCPSLAQYVCHSQ